MITERFLTDPAECQYNIWRSASQSWLHLDCWLGNISQASPEFPFLFDWKISILGIVIPYWYATLCSNGPPSWRWRRSTLTRWQSCCQTLAGSSQTPSGGNWTSDRQERAWTGSWCWKYIDLKHNIIIYIQKHRVFVRASIDPNVRNLFLFPPAASFYLRVETFRLPESHTRKLSVSGIPLVYLLHSLHNLQWQSSLPRSWFPIMNFISSSADGRLMMKI